MRGILPLAFALLSVAGLLTACGPERAVRVEIQEEGAPRASGDALCLVAHAAGEVAFASEYSLDELPDGERSLTFIEGERTQGSVAITAMVLRDGLVMARATALARFDDQGTVRQVLRPRRCHPGGAEGVGSRPGGAFVRLAASPHMLATDIDGDGRDELLAIAADGSLQVLDADVRDGGSRRATELLAPEGVLVASGDLDGDCLLDVVATAPTGALVVLGEGGRSQSPVGDAPTDAAIGVRAENRNRGVAMVGAAGITITPWDEDAPRRIASGTWSRIRAADLTNDGRDDLVVSGVDGTRVFVALADGWRDQIGALPSTFSASTGPFAIGDLDGDGTLDVASASGDALRVGLNRGDGLIEDRTGAVPIALGAEAARMALADLDGDCAEEVVVLDVGGTLVVAGRDALGVWERRTDVPEGTWDDMAVLDADGDGSSEVALLDATGSVTLWRP